MYTSIGVLFYQHTDHASGALAVYTDWLKMEGHVMRAIHLMLMGPMRMLKGPRDAWLTIAGKKIGQRH